MCRLMATSKDVSNPLIVLIVKMILKQQQENKNGGTDDNNSNNKIAFNYIQNRTSKYSI